MNTPVHCDDCGQDVQLHRTETGTLRVACDCDMSAVRVAKKNPSGWSE